jgi:hypothetical protein
VRVIQLCFYLKATCFGAGIDLNHAEKYAVIEKAGQNAVIQNIIMFCVGCHSFTVPFLQKYCKIMSC